jgi:MFS transporter, PAT family, beta-lactamase induction signal transducer AmpG
MNEIELVGAEALQEPLPEGAPAVKERPWIFGLLIAPSAVLMNGMIQGGVLGFLLSQQGIGSGGQSHIIWLLSLPTSLYFLWSPVTDFLVRRRTWLLTGSLTGAVLMAAAFQRKNLTSPDVMVLLFVSACCGQLVVSSCGGMMGALRLERSRRVAGSFYQCGGLAFGAAAVSVLIWMSSRVSQSVLGVIAAALIAIPALFALAAPRQEAIADAAFGQAMSRIWIEFKATFLRWDALPYTLCMLFPMASGAAIGLLTGVASQYHVSSDSVAWMNGFFGTLLTVGGTLAATLVPARIRAAVAYLSMGVLNAGTLCVLWLGPLQPSTYYLGVTLYLFTVGTCYALFTAVVLEFLGYSGKTKSGRYSIINSLGNVPVLYMLRLDGWGGDKWGARGLSGTEAVIGGVGGAILLAYFLIRKGVWVPEGVVVEA